MEVIDIDLNNITSASVPSSSSRESPGVNFGGGLEFLMNDKKKSSSSKVDLGELDNLEAELNNLSSESSSSSSSSSGNGTKQLSGLSGLGFSNLFGGFSGTKNQGSAAPSEKTETTHLGQQTKETGASDSRTWDGFSKVNGEIPSQSTSLNEREKRRKKRMMIKKLEEWREKGKFSHGTQFDMNSAYDEVEDEYEGALEEKRKKDAIKLQGWWFTTVINTLEYGNALVNPFDLNLDGWGEQVSEDLDSYDEIFAELHEKYKGGKMAPEISLLLRVGFSAAVVNMSNKMLSSAAPGFGDVIKQSPELMKMFQGAAVNTMSKENSVFDFAKSMLNPPEKVNTSYGPPPAPMETKNMPPQSRPGMQFTSRPDLAASKVDMEIPQQKSSRPEMKGPPMANIDQLLSGLKQKTPAPAVEDVNGGDDSMISVTSLRDMNNATLPKRVRKRRNNSDKNSVVLDI
uniref:Uncharacterized protein n=1 Tax=viral metagenome TaxID=1070528 RepID=A0A6C0HK25_9ZZZZ